MKKLDDKAVEKICENLGAGYQCCDYYIEEAGHLCTHYCRPCTNHIGYNFNDYSDEDLDKLNLDDKTYEKICDMALFMEGEASKEQTFLSGEVPDWVTDANINNYWDFYYGRKTYNKFLEDWID